MSNKEFKSTLAEIVKTVNANNKVITELKKENALLKDVIHNIHQRTEDMSKKFDEVLNAGTKTPVTKQPAKKAPAKKTADDKKAKPKAKTKEKEESTSDDSSKPIKNIMTYFKTKYVEDAEFFDSILEEKQAEAVFTEYEDEIKTKKAGVTRDKLKASMLYRNLNANQKKKIREKMLEEHEKSTTNEEEDVEAESGSDSE